MYENGNEISFSIPQEKISFIRHDLRQCIRSMDNLMNLIKEDELCLDDAHIELGITAKSLRKIYAIIFPS